MNKRIMLGTSIIAFVGCTASAAVFVLADLSRFVWVPSLGAAAALAFAALVLLGAPDH